MQYTEYNNSAVSSGGCNYASLARYNANKGVSGIPVPRTNVSGVYLVPTYGAPGYNTLTHNSAPSCSGFFNINTAYGQNANNCNTQYVKSMCNSGYQ